MKRRSFFRLYRDELGSDKISHLSDAQFRLLTIFNSMAGWDARQTENYKMVKRSLREIRASLLPTWGVSKLSRITNELASKKLITRIGNSRIKIGISVPIPEKTVPPVENSVPESEQKRIDQRFEEIKNMLKDKGIL